MLPYVLSLDIGTTSTKAIAFTQDNQIMAQYSLGYPILHPQPNFSEQNPTEIWQAVGEGIRKIQKDTQKIGNLQAISFSAAMHSLICVDKKGKPLTNCIIWADNRSAEIAEKLKKTPIGQQIYAQTGAPIHPMLPLCKLLWLKEQEPEIFAQTQLFIGMKEYIFYQLTGNYLVDYSLASATGLFDNQTFAWSKLALDLIGINESRLPPLVPIFHYELSKPEWTEGLGIPENTPLVIGGSDGGLANLGAGATKQGRLALTIGTSGAARTCVSKPLIDKQMRTFCYALSQDLFILGGGMNNGGIVIDWLQKILLRDSEKPVNPLIISELAQDIAIGSDGLLFLPYLLGERAPWYDANAKGVFFGVQIQHTPAHFARAVLEGITLAMYSIGESIVENGQNIEVIYASGGFAHSKFWVQIVADVFGIKVILNESVEASAWGAALVAWQALGIIEDFGQTGDFAANVEVFEPNWANHQVYQSIFKKFTRLYQVLKPEF
jgi:gluconokinase